MQTEDRGDSGAMLLAVLAVGTSGLLQAGAWSLHTTIISVVAATVMVCYVWPRKGDVPITKRKVIATSISLGFIAAIGSAWVVQSVAALITGHSILPAIAGGLAADSELTLTWVGSLGGYVIGMVGGVVIAWQLRRAHGEEAVSHKPVAEPAA